MVKHPELKTTITQFNDQFTVSEQLFKRFKEFCREKNLKFEDREFVKDADFIKLRLKAEIAQRIWDKNAYYYVILNEERQFQIALKSFDEAKRLAALE